MKKYKILSLLNSDAPLDNVLINGWVRTRRDSGGFSFIEINDGSCLKNAQIIADKNLPDYDDIKKLSTGSAVTVLGNLVESKGSRQKWEVQANKN